MQHKPTSVWSAFSCLPQIHSMGVTIFDPIWSQRLHSNPRSIEFLHVLKGRVRLILPKVHLDAGPGDTLLVPTGVLHRDEFDLRSGLEIFMIHFRWQAEKEFFRRMDLRSLSLLSPSLKTEINMIVDRMRSDITGSMEGDRAVACARLMTVLILLLRAAEERKPGKAARNHDDARQVRRRLLMAQARQYLEQHFAEPVTLDHIAKTLGISAYYLSHVFSEESNFALFSYFTNLRMEKARALLTEGNRNVAEVAYAVGYDDSSYFSRVFHRHFGFAPHTVIKARISRPLFKAKKS